MYRSKKVAPIIVSAVVMVGLSGCSFFGGDDDLKEEVHYDYLAENSSKMDGELNALHETENFLCTIGDNGWLLEGTIVNPKEREVEYRVRGVSVRGDRETGNFVEEIFTVEPMGRKDFSIPLSGENLKDASGSNKTNIEPGDRCTPLIFKKATEEEIAESKKGELENAVFPEDFAGEPTEEPLDEILDGSLPEPREIPEDQKVNSDVDINDELEELASQQEAEREAEEETQAEDSE